MPSLLPRLAARLLLVICCCFFVVYSSFAQGIQWSTYMGGTGVDNPLGLVRDGNNDLYILGRSGGNGFPVTPGAFQSSLGNATAKLTLSKLSGATGNLLWSTYLGADDDNMTNGRIQWDAVSNTIVVSGVSGSPSGGYPVLNGHGRTNPILFSPVMSQFSTNGTLLFSTYLFSMPMAYQTFNFRTEISDGFACFMVIDDVYEKVIVTSVNLSAKQIAYETRFGGSNGVLNSSGLAFTRITISNGEVYVGGTTTATDFPTTPGAYQTSFPSNNGGEAYFIAKLNTAGNLAFCTYANTVDYNYAYFFSPVAVGPNEVAVAAIFQDGIPVSPGGIAYDNITPTNLGILKLDKNTGGLVYFTYFGGNTESFPFRDIRYVGKNVVVNGNSQDGYLPVTPNAIQRFNSYSVYTGAYNGDCFIAQLDSANNIVYCSYLGGTGSETLSNAVVSGDDIVYTGNTTSNNFPVTPNATQPLLKGGTADIVLVRYNTRTRAVTYASYLGTNGGENIPAVPVIAGNDVYVLANCYQNATYPITNDFPVSPDAFQKTVIGSKVPSNHQYLAKINTATGKLVYGSYFTSLLPGDGATATAFTVNGNDVYLAGSNWADDYPVTPNAVQTTIGGNRDIHLTKITLCESNLVNDTLLPAQSAVCAGALIAPVVGSVPEFGGLPAILRNGVPLPQTIQGSFTYQWQVSTDSVNWNNIPGALQKDYTPDPLVQKTYFRRIARTTSCNNVHVSSVATIGMNGKVATKPDVGSGGAYFACPGSNLTLGVAAVPGMTYNWQPATHLTTTNAAQTVFNHTQPGAYTYVLYGTDANGCTAMDTATVINYKANAGTDKVLCPDKNTQLGGAPLAGLAGVSYQWTPAVGLSCNTCAQPLVNASGTYVLTVSVPVSGGGNCVTRDTVTVTTGNRLIDPAGPDQTICNQGVVTLGTPRVAGYTYNWTPGVFLSGSANVSQPVFNQLNASIYLTYNPINYILTATNPAGCTTIDTAKVYIADAYAGYVTCRPGQLGKPDYTRGQATYEWVEMSNGMEVPVGPNELSSTTVSNPRALANANVADKTYRVKMTWNGITCTSDVLVLATCGGCPGVDIQFKSKSGCPNVINNDSVRMYVNNPAPGYIYVWTPAIGLNKTIGTEVKTGVNISTEYTVTAVNTLDTSFQCSNTIKVNFFTPTSPAFQAPDVTICKDATVLIGLAPVAGLNYAWTTDNNPFNIYSTDANPAVTGVQTTNYYVKVTDPASNCYVNDTVLVTVPYVPVNAGLNRPSCSSGGFTIGTPAIAGFIYNWSPATGLSSASTAQPTVVSNSADIDYTLTVTDPVSGCQAMDTISIQHTDNPVLDPMPIPAPYCQGSNGSVQLGNAPLNGVTYSWSPTTGLSDPNIAQPIANPGVTTTYTVTANFSGSCATPATDQVTVEVTPKPTVSVSATSNCSGSQLTAVTNAAAPVYTWTPSTGLNSNSVSNPFSTTNVPVNYEVNVVDQTTNCFNTANINIVPAVTANAGDDVSYCAGGTALLGAAGTAGVSYNWQPATGLSNANTAQPATLTNLAPGEYVYTLTATGPACNQTDSVRVTVLAPPALETSVGVTLCKNASVQLGQQPQVGVFYTWTPASNLSDANVSNPIANPLQTTTYTLTATNSANNCTATASTVVTVTATGAPAISVADNVMCKGDTLQLNAIATPAGSYSYVWTPDQYFVSNRFISNPSVAPQANIAYQVLVTNTTNGCANTVTANVVVKDTCNVFPVTWLGFTAVLKNGKALLDWRVAMEQNNHHFTILKSADGIRWNTLLTVPSLGNTAQPRTYRSVDEHPLNDITYYRILQTDNDGKMSYSPIRSVRTGSTDPLFVIYPNPTHDVLHYTLSTATANAELQLHTADGRLLQSIHITSGNGTIALKQYPAGTYLITLKDKTGRLGNKRVVLQK